jgi:hypothetical protein
MKKNYLKKSQKLLTLFTVFNLISFVINAQVPIPEILHYKFDGVGSSITNYASSPPVGTAMGTIVGAQTQTGSVNCINALVGTGGSSTTDYVNTGWATNLSGTSWSISFWTSNITPSATLFYIFGDVNTSSLRCFTNGVAGANNWILRGGGLTDILLVGAATTTPNLVTFVYNQSTANVVGYINAIPTVTVAQGALTLTGTGPFKIGSYGSNTGLNAGGLMADFRIYSTALSDPQILSIYNYNATPTVSITGSNLICEGDPASLTVSGATSYSWSSGATTNTVILTPTVSTTYTVIGTAGSCTASAVSSITVNASPTISVTSGAICSGQSFTMVPSGATTYSFSSGTAIVTPTTSLSYSVTGTSSLGCVSSNAAISTVTVNALPTVNAISNNSVICVGETATLTASGTATSYTWNTTATTSVIAVSPITTTTYTVTGAGATGCESTTTITQNVNLCTGINELTKNGIVSIYPNPNNGVFTVELSTISKVTLTNSLGQIIIDKTFEAGNHTFDIQNEVSGIYFVKVINGNQHINHRLIINK